MKTRITLITLLVISLIFGGISSFHFISKLDNMDIRLFSAVNSTGIVLVVAGILLQIIGHVIRAKKHALLLEQIRPIRFMEVFKGQMIGFLFNASLPLRLGEIIRAHYIGKGVKISRSAVFGTILFERIVDLVVVMSFALLVPLFFLPKTSLEPFLLVIGNALLSLALLVVAVWSIRSQYPRLLRLIYHSTALFNQKIKNRLRLMSWSLIYGLKTVLNYHILPRYLYLSVAMWLCYGLSIALIAGALQPHLMSIASSTISSYLSISTPIGPTYLVSYRAILAGLLQTLGENGTYILSFSILSWLILVVPSIILGTYYVIRRQSITNNSRLSRVEVMKNKLYRDVDISGEFGSFLDTYFKGVELNRILNNHEMAKEFTVVKTFKGGSNALTLLAWQNDKMVVKKITLPQFADKLSAQYQWLHQRHHLEHTAKVLEEEKNSDSYAINLTYHDDYITFFDFVHSSSVLSSWRVLRNILDFMNSEIYKPTIINDQQHKLDEYIENKVIGKVRDAANTSTTISRALEEERLIVNGRKLMNFNEVIKKIQQNKTAMSDVANFNESPIHGDLTVDNIIVNPVNKDFVLLDPNNENAISDAVTDYGKMFQSLHSGYEFLVLIKSAELTGNKIVFEEKTSMQYNNLYKRLSTYLSNELPTDQYRAILFHEAVHYCRMLTYRVHINPQSAIAFYAIAVRLFNDFIEQYEKH